MKTRKKSTRKKKVAASSTVSVVPPKKRRGPPSIFSKTLADTICKRLGRGESLRRICQDDSMPDIGTVLDWLFDDDKKPFQEAYDNARRRYAHFVFEETIDLANDAVKLANKGRTSTAHARINALRLMIDTRKWALGRMDPKFKESLDITSKGKQIKDPRPVAITYVRPATS